MPVECKIPRFVQFATKDKSTQEAKKTPGEYTNSHSFHSENRIGPKDYGYNYTVYFMFSFCGLEWSRKSAP